MSADSLVLNLLVSTNKPYHAQGVADMLATQGVRKTAAEKSLMALAAANKIVMKEFGKSKIFFASQEGLSELQPHEKAEKLGKIKDLNETCRTQAEQIAALKKELAANKTQLTVAELRERLSELQTKVSNMENKLVNMRSGATLVSEKDIVKVEKDFQRLLDLWVKRKRIFGGLWDAISENMDNKQRKDIFESQGIETDEQVGELVQDYRKLLQGSKKQRRA